MNIKQGTIPPKISIPEEENYSVEQYGYFEDETVENPEEEQVETVESDSPETDSESQEDKSELDLYIDELNKKTGDSTDESPTHESHESHENQNTTYTEADKKFNASFEKLFGMPVNDALNLVQELIAFRSQVEASGGTKALAQMSVARQEELLKTDWQVDQPEFNQRMRAIRAYFNTLPPNKQQALDDVDGAKIIWAKIEGDLKKRSMKATPSINRSSRATTPQGRINQPKQLYKMSDLVEMSDDDYRRINWSDIPPEAVEYDPSYIRAF
jgi:hypothetical protein